MEKTIKHVNSFTVDNEKARETMSFNTLEMIKVPFYVHLCCQQKTMKQSSLNEVIT